MASNTKDFIVNILADTKRFLLNGAEKELENLGDAAKHSGKNLDAMGKDTDAAAKDIKDLGHDAEATAKKVDSAFDKIASSSKSNLRQVDASAEHAKKGLDNFKEEAHSTGKEAAASFSGSFDDVASTVQETAANAFAGFGPLGAAAGIAAAAGIGILTTKMNEAKERIKNLTGMYVDLMLNDPGHNKPAERIKEITDAAKGNGELGQWGEDLRNTGISAEVFAKALDGDPLAKWIVKLELAKYAQRDLFGNNAKQQSAKNLTNIVNEHAEAMKSAAASTKTYNEMNKAAVTQQEAVAKAEEAATKAAEHSAEVRSTVVGVMGSVGDASDALSQKVQDAAQKEADATKSTSDSWSDHADAVKLSAKDIISVLDEQTKAAEEFQSNLLDAQKRGDGEFTAWVAQQPANVAAAYAAGTAKEKTGIYNAYKRNVGASAGAGIAAGMTESAAVVAAAAAGIHAGAQAKLGQPLTIPVIVGAPPAAQVAQVANAILTGIGTIVIPTRVGGPARARGISAKDLN